MLLDDVAATGILLVCFMRTVDALDGGAATAPRRVLPSSRRTRLPIRTDIPGSQTTGFHGAIRVHWLWPAGRIVTPFLD